MPARRRKSANDRSYDTAHRKRREQLLPRALGTPCPCASCPRCRARGRPCHRLMVDPKQMHLDHSTPLALGGRHGDRIVCAPCNTSAGAALGNHLRGQRRHAITRKPPVLDHSRAW